MTERSRAPLTRVYTCDCGGNDEDGHQELCALFLYDGPGWGLRSDVIVERTVICAPDPNDPSRYLELTRLNKSALNIDSGYAMSGTTTRLTIDGIDYLPLGSSIEVTRKGAYAYVTSTVIVAPRTP